MTQTSRRWRPVAAIAAGVLSFIAGAFALWIYSLGPVPLGTRVEFSTAVVDRDGRLLRALRHARRPLAAAGAGRRDVDPRFLAARRLRGQALPKPSRRRSRRLAARGRAVARDSGHIVSGGSTLTMQVARLLEPRRERRLVAKLRQIVRAVELERDADQGRDPRPLPDLAPYGGNLEGIRAASLAYFGKEPRRLTLGESALLVALPQSPEARRPDRSAETARARPRPRARPCRVERPVCRHDEIAQAKAEPVPAGRRRCRCSPPMRRMRPWRRCRAVR